MPASASTTAAAIKRANIRYHDAAAAEYDSKWGIDFGPIGREQVRAKVAKALGGWPARRFPEALEIGSGTGYFSLNLLQLGLIGRLVATDISPGMLGELAATAKRLGLDLETAATDAERLPFQDQSFDLVFGHAVLHHLPALPAALAEFRRVLRPGGTLAFCGEPSRYGNLLATVPRTLDEMLREAGFANVRIRGEELLANLYGWTVRTLEGTAEPEDVPHRWRELAFRSYLALQRVDAALLEPRLPPSLFYNLVLSAIRT